MPEIVGSSSTASRLKRKASSGEETPQRHRRGLLLMAWRLLQHDVVGQASLVLLMAAALAAVAAPMLGLQDPIAVDTNQMLAVPGTPGHPLGTDELGRDILSRLVWGARVSLLVPFVPILSAVIVGVILGLLAGYLGGRVDVLIMRTLDVLLAFPSVLLAIAIAAALGPGLANVLLAIGIVEMPTYSRLVRAVVLSARQLDYVEAARCLGASDARIVFRHVLPNITSPIVVYGTLGFGRVIITSASLSFLGLGVQPPVPDWGSMLDAGRKVLVLAPHVSTISGIAILVVTLAINFLGDLMRDVLDPRMGTS